MRRILGIILLALLALWIGTSPHQAAQVAEKGGDKVAAIARGFGTFFTEIVT